MRVIILDTETTGLSPKSGDRIIEIGCIEMISHRITGNTFHTYINPERDVPAKSTEITGLTSEFLKPFPIFSKIVDPFLEFISDSPLVIHNATFDMNFINAELGWLNKELIPNTRAIDTLQMARKKFPGAPASLNALCKRFDIDLSRREKHGALLDAELLCEVYIELMGGRQKTLSQAMSMNTESVIQKNVFEIYTKHSEDILIFPSRSFTISKEEELAHEQFINTLKNPMWTKYKNAK